MLSSSFYSQQKTNVQKELFKIGQKANEESCPYCLMKRKFNIGSGEEQKCFEHSMKIEFSTQDGEEFENNSDQGFLTADDMIEALESVEDGLDYYWDHLRQLSQGNPSNIHRDLEPVLGSVRRVQDKINKFFYDSQVEISQIKPISQHQTSRKYQCTGSQKFVRNEFSLNVFDPEEQISTDAIKEWVMHFYKVLNTRRIVEQIEQLSFQEDLEMRIFKQSMERKFLAFAEEIEKYEKKIHGILTKLIYYMEKSSENVPNEKIQEDILFIQSTSTLPEARESSLERILILQASSIEHLLRSSQT